MNSDQSGTQRTPGTDVSRMGMGRELEAVAAQTVEQSIGQIASAEALEEQRVSFMIRELITLADRKCWSCGGKKPLSDAARLRITHAEMLGTSILSAYRALLAAKGFSDV